MWFKKNKKENAAEGTHKKDENMSKLIDEVLNEQAQAKEAAMRESSQTAQSTEEPVKTDLAGLIARFYENRNEQTFKTVVNALFSSTLFLTMTPVRGSENKEEKTMQFSPVLVKNNDGEKLLPAFSDKSLIPKEQAEKLSAVSMPFAAACELIAKAPDCDKIIVNPFTQPFTVSKEIVENTAKAAAERRNRNNATVEFSLPEEGTKTVVKTVTDYFKNESEIKAAYFTKMKNQGVVSYAFIIDCPDEHTVFPKLIDFLKLKKIALPITLLPYSKLEKVVRESRHIKKVY